MLFTIKLEGSDQPVIVTARASVEGTTAYLSIIELLGSADALPYLASVGLRGSVQLIGGRLYPVADPLSSGQSLDVSALFKLSFEHPNLTDFSTLEQRVNIPGFTAKDIAAIWEGSSKFRSYVDGKVSFRVDVPSLFVMSSEAIEAVKVHNDALGHKFEHISSDINKTNFMSSPADKLFIKIPDYNKLQNIDLELGTFLPDLKEIAEPYPHMIYHTVYGDAYLDANPSEQKRLIANYYALIGEKNPGTFVPSISPELVKGNPANNATGILPNEEAYFLALKEYIQYDIKQVNPSGDVEDLYYKKLVCSRRMREYLDNLIDMAYRLNWNHLNKMALRVEDISEDDEDQDDEDDSTSSDSVNADNKLFAYHNELEIDEAMPRLKGYIEAVAASGVGFDAHIEAIIKLLRWGDTKPTVLKLDGYNEAYFDLHTFRRRNSLGTLSSVIPVKYNEHDLQPLGFIIFGERFKDPDYRDKIGKSDISKIEVPVGMVCVRHYAEGLHQVVALSMFDIVTAYSNNPGCRLIYGVKYESGSFSFDLNLDLEKESHKLRSISAHIASQASSLEAVFYESSTMKELGLEFGFKGLSTLGILNTILHGNGELSKWGSLLAFNTREELKAKMKDNPFPADLYFSTNIALELVPILLETTEKFDQSPDFSLGNVLNLYKHFMGAANYKGEDSFLKIVEPAQEVSTSVSNPVSAEKMELFGETMETSNDYLKLLNETLIESVPITAAVSSIMDGKAIIGGFTSKVRPDGTKYYILLAESEVPANTPESSNSYMVVVPMLFDALINTLRGTPEKSALRFSSMAALDHYRKVLVAAHKRSIGK